MNMDWKKMLLLERIRDFSDAEFRSTTAGIFYKGDEIEELVHEAKRAYEADELDRCERFCEEAEVLFLRERGKVLKRIRKRAKEVRTLRKRSGKSTAAAQAAIHLVYGGGKRSNKTTAASLLLKGGAHE
jgi:hypothetical protein